MLGDKAWVGYAPRKEARASGLEPRFSKPCQIPKPVLFLLHHVLVLTHQLKHVSLSFVTRILTWSVWCAMHDQRETLEYTKNCHFKYLFSQYKIAKEKFAWIGNGLSVNDSLESIVIGLHERNFTTSLNLGYKTNMKISYLFKILSNIRPKSWQPHVWAMKNVCRWCQIKILKSKNTI